MCLLHRPGVHGRAAASLILPLASRGPRGAAPFEHIHRRRRVQVNSVCEHAVEDREKPAQEALKLRQDLVAPLVNALG